MREESCVGLLQTTRVFVCVGWSSGAADKERLAGGVVSVYVRTEEYGGTVFRISYLAFLPVLGADISHSALPH